MRNPQPTAPPPQTEKRTFCRICEAHCGLRIEVAETGSLTHIRPDRSHPISQGGICAKGTRFLELADHPERLLYPLRRRPDGGFEQVSWATALAYFGERIRPILAQHGPHAVALYLGTPAIHNSLGSMAYFAFARALGTRNLYSAGSQDNNNKIVASRLVHGNEWTPPIMDLEHADFALLLGTNPVVSQGTYMQLPGGTTAAFDHFIKRGGRLVIVDPRQTESARRWGGHMPIQPGTDIFLLLSLLYMLRDRYRPDPRVSGLEELLGLAAEYPPERTAPLTGISPEQVAELAASISSARRATFFLSLGVNQGPFGTLSAVALQALAYLSGNFDREGGLLFQPWSKLLGWLLHCKTHYSRIGGYLSNAGGLPAAILPDEILTPGEGQIRALVVFSGNPLTSTPDEARLRCAFTQLELLVCIDIFQNQTSSLSDLILPATTWLERFDFGAWNAMFAVAPFVETTPPMRMAPGQCRPEWRIFADLSIAAGRPLIGPLTGLLTRVNWDEILQPLLDSAAFPWKAPVWGAKGLPWYMPRSGAYLRGRRRVQFWHSALQSEPERLAHYAGDHAALQADNSGFILLGRRRRLGQNSWIHGASHHGKTEAEVWLCPEDMARLGLQPGADVIVSSPTGAIRLPAYAREGVMPGTVVVPHGLPEANVNQLISSNQALIEPLSGMHRMTGNRVQVRAAIP